jgi:nitrogenase molybdenum-cofactor synthesis protein NifE
MKKDYVVCGCMVVTRNTIEEAILEKGCTTFEEIKELTEAGSVCGQCEDEINEIIEEVLPKK